MELKKSMDELNVNASTINVANCTNQIELVYPPIDETNSTNSINSADDSSSNNHFSVAENQSHGMKCVDPIVIDAIVKNEPIQIEEVNAIPQIKHHPKEDNNIGTTSIEFIDLKKVELSICYEEKSQHVSTELATNASFDESDSANDSIEEMYNDSVRRSTCSSTIDGVSIGESKSGNENRNFKKDKNFDIEVIERNKRAEGYDVEGTNHAFWE